MKQRFVLVGKRLVLPLLVIAGCVSLYAFRVADIYTDLWQQLGIGKESGTNSIKESFLGGYLQHYGARNIRNIALGDRVAVTKDLLAFTKQYVESDAFKKEYAVTREQRKPTEPKKPKTEAEIRTEQVNNLKKSIAEIEKSMKTAKDDMKKIFHESLEVLQKQLKDYEDPKNEIIPLMAQGEQSQYEYYLKKYREETEAWQDLFPENSRAFVKKRLQQMLEDTKGVDYNAELVERSNKKKYFVNPVYEKKPGNWKYAFRAGKEVTETARAFVQDWLKSL